jgi:O-antigen/teichoic acid export membrane protein
MKQVFESLRRHQFFSLVGGVAASNLLSLLAMPILTRMYPVSSFGLFAIFWSLATILGMFATLRFEMAIPAIQAKDEAHQVSRIALLFSVMAAVAFLPLWYFTPLSTLIHQEPDPNLGCQIALGAILNSVLQIQNQVSIRLGHLRALSLRNIFEKVVFVVAAFALAQWPAYGLIVAQLLGLAGATLLLIYANRPWPSLSLWIAPAQAVSLLKAYRDYPVKNGPATGLLILSTQLPQLIFSSLFSLEALGFYSLAQRLIDAPNAVLNSALSIVYYRRMLNARKDEMKRIFMRTLRLLAFVMVGPVIVLSFYSKPLVSLVFGQQWEPSALYLVALLPILFFRTLYVAGQSLFLVLRQLTHDLWVSAAVFAGSIGGLLAGYALFGTPEGMIGLASALTAVAYIFGVCLIFKNVDDLAVAKKI